MTTMQDRAYNLLSALEASQPSDAKLTPDQWDRIFAFIERLLPLIFPFIVGK